MKVIKQLLIIITCLNSIVLNADTLNTKYTISIGGGITFLNYKEDLSKDYNYSFNKNNYRLVNKNYITTPVSFTYYIGNKIGITYNVSHSIKGHIVELKEYNPPYFEIPYKHEIRIYTIDNLVGLRLVPFQNKVTQAFIELSSGLQYNYQTINILHSNYYGVYKNEGYFLGRKIKSINNFQIGSTFWISKSLGFGANYILSFYHTGKAMPYQGDWQFANNAVFSASFRW